MSVRDTMTHVPAIGAHDGSPVRARRMRRVLAAALLDMGALLEHVATLEDQRGVLTVAWRGRVPPAIQADVMQRLGEIWREVGDEPETHVQAARAAAA